jgi:prepilin-type N-terminal cleavage/methylation domain-containing protein
MNSTLYHHNARGFTMIELMITMVIGMVILAGAVSLFVNNTRLATTLADRTERLGDLYTASHIIQTELRSAQGNLTSVVNAGPVTTVTYTPIDSICTGFFEYRQYPNSVPPYYEIRWKRPISVTTGLCNNGFAQQLIRDLDPVNGMVVTPLGVNPYTASFLNIDLYSLYTDPDKNLKTVSLSFKIWSRN